METQSGPHAAATPSDGGFSTSDFGFFALMALVVVAVTWVGVLSFEEGMHTEKSKRNGEAWVAWLTENSAKRSDPDYPLRACAAGLQAPTAAQPSEPAPEGATEEAPKPAAAAAPNTWGACVAEIVKVPAFAAMVNPFTGKTPELVEKCDPADHNLHGNIAIEKSISNPPGSAVPVTISSLVPGDAIDTKLQLKLSICDKGAYPIKVSEFEF